MPPKTLRAVCGVLLLLIPVGAAAEWTNRYPKIANVAHHVYVEGFNLPTLAAGPTDPAASPDGATVAFAARGWLWLMDQRTRRARRLTRGAGVDSGPAWSPDGKQLAFVRDDSRDTSIVVADVATGRERTIVDTPTLDLDPAFSHDGRSLFYSSAAAGDLDLWRLDLASGRSTRLTTAAGLEMQPRPLPGDAELSFITKPSPEAIGPTDSVALLNLRDGTQRLLRGEGIASQMRAAPAPDGRSVAMTVPAEDRGELLLMGVRGGPPVHLATSARRPLEPAWSPDGAHLYFVQPDAEERFQLHRTASAGGPVETLTPTAWDWGEPTGRITIRTRLAGGARNVPARLSVADRSGHPAVPSTGMARFDGQHGRVFFYSPGSISVEAPAGPVRVRASHGFQGATEVTATVSAGATTIVDVEIPQTGFNAAQRGWSSADLHSHLNYGGPYALSPEDLVADMRGEDLDLATPQIANLHTIIMDDEWWGWRRTEKPLIAFAQEVRSHFLGHVAVVGADAMYRPAFYGPGYPVYEALDLPNAAALGFAREHGGLNVYVHPVSVKDPFPTEGAPRGLPLELVPDALLGDVDTLEVVCLWSDELGTSEAWYRLLNLGLPIQPSAGSDTMHNFHRTMAVGSTRIYAKPRGPLNVKSFLDAVRAGRSFVSNGPTIEFSVGGVEPGGVLNAVGGRVEWTLDAWSATPVEKAEIIVNGRVAWSGPALDRAGRRTFSGRVEVPAGGWIAARVHGGESRWPVQDSYPFAHTAPIWLGKVGSRDPEAARASARDLLRWMDVADKRLDDNYPAPGGASLKARFAEAREILRRQATP